MLVPRATSECRILVLQMSSKECHHFVQTESTHTLHTLQVACCLSQHHRNTALYSPVGPCLVCFFMQLFFFLNQRTTTRVIWFWHFTPEHQVGLIGNSIHIDNYWPLGNFMLRLRSPGLIGDPLFSVSRNGCLIIWNFRAPSSFELLVVTVLWFLQAVYRWLNGRDSPVAGTKHIDSRKKIVGYLRKLKYTVTVSPILFIILLQTFLT